MTVHSTTRTQPTALTAHPVPPADLVNAHHRRRRRQRAQGHAGDPRRRADRRRRSRGSATTRCWIRSGACRQCLVEVEGQRKPMAACTTTCTDGMVVRTQFTSEVADKAQHGVMELLLINHPLDCPVCDKGGECPLQNQAMSNGRAETRFDDVKRTFPEADQHLHPGAAGSGTLRAVRPLHPVLQADRRRPVHRAAGARGAPARISTTGDLLGEPGAPLAQHATVTVEQDLGGDRQRLGERALHVAEPRGPVAVAHRLVLQRALAALVARRAVQRVVDQQELEHPVLRLVRHGRGALGPTTMPGVASRVQEACGLGIGRTVPSRSGTATSTRHCRHAPTGLSSGWSQNRGIAMPSCSAARITSVPLGTVTPMPSSVR